MSEWHIKLNRLCRISRFKLLPLQFSLISIIRESWPCDFNYTIQYIMIDNDQDLLNDN